MKNVEAENAENVRLGIASKSMYISALSADLLLVTVGSVMVWGSAAVPKLTSNTDINPLDLPVTSLELSILLSAPTCGSLFSLNIVAYISDKIGRKKSLLLTAISFLVCLNAIAFAKNLYVYYIFLFIIGFNMASSCVNVSTYNSEIVDDRSRTWLGCIVGLSFPAGNLIGFILGTYLTTITQYTLAISLPVYVHILLQYFMVESPMHLACKKKKAEAFLALEKLRHYANPIDVEIDYNRIKELNLKRHNKKGKIFDILGNNLARKAFFVCLILSFTQQSCGISIVMNYAVPIFNDAGSVLSGNYISILLGVVQVVIYGLVSINVNLLGRRPLLLLSAFGCAISTSVLAIYFYLKQFSPDVASTITVVPLISAMTFMFSYSSGLGPITLSYLGELFCNELRTTAIATVLVLDALVAATLIFTFPLFAEAFGVYMCMLIYSGSAFVGFFLMIKFLPETRGKSFIEIQYILKEL